MKSLSDCSEYPIRCKLDEGVVLWPEGEERKDIYSTIDLCAALLIAASEFSSTYHIVGLKPTRHEGIFQ